MSRFPRHRRRRAIDGKARRFRHALRRDRHHHDRGLRSVVRRRIAGHRGSLRRDGADARALYRFVRGARHGEFRADGQRPGTLPRPHAAGTQSHRDADAHDAGGERPRRTLDRRTAQSHGRPDALLPAGRRRLGARLARARPFSDPNADTELFRALEATVRQTGSRRLIRMPEHINDPRFAAEIAAEFRRLFGGRLTRRRARG